MSERPPQPEMRQPPAPEIETKSGLGRKLEGAERQREEDELREQIAGLEAALSDPDLDDETRAELEELLEPLKDSLSASEAGGDWFKYDNK
jgi:hypothetical protein